MSQVTRDFSQIGRYLRPANRLSLSRVPFHIRSSTSTPSSSRLLKRWAEETGSGIRGSLVFDPDKTKQIREEAEQTFKSAVQRTEDRKAAVNASEAELFNNLAVALKEAKMFGLSSEDARLYPRIQMACQDLEENYGYKYKSDQLAGGWKLLFTTSQAYRNMQGMTGLSKAPMTELHSLYQILRKEKVTELQFQDALRSLPSVEEAQALSEEKPYGTSATVEVLNTFGSSKIKNEMRGIFMLDDIDNDGYKFTGVDQIVTEADSGGQENMPAASRAIQICSYISSDDQFRISRSTDGTVFIFQRVEDIEDLFEKMNLPKRGGSTWGGLFGR